MAGMSVAWPVNVRPCSRPTSDGLSCPLLLHTWISYTGLYMLQSTWPWCTVKLGQDEYPGQYAQVKKPVQTWVWDHAKSLLSQRHEETSRAVQAVQRPASGNFIEMSCNRYFSMLTITSIKRYVAFTFLEGYKG